MSSTLISQIKIAFDLLSYDKYYENVKSNYNFVCVRSVGYMDGIWHDGNNRNSFSIVTWSVHELTKLEYPKNVIVMEGKSGSITSSF